MNQNVGYRIKINGHNPLWGRVKIQGSKNSALPILAATILIKGKCRLTNVPDISDITCMCSLLEHMGCVIHRSDDNHEIEIDASEITQYELPTQTVRQMRSSIILLGSMLGRMKKAVTCYPGGCVIGERPIDLHLKALEALGTRITIKDNNIYTQTGELRGNKVTFPLKSVGATENLLLAGATAKGQTIICNPSVEPEVITLCDFLNQAGADIRVDYDEDRIIINGVDELRPVQYRIVPDRIVCGTYLFATMAARGEILLEDAPIEYMSSVINLCEQMGAHVYIYEERKQIHLKVYEDIKNIDFVETLVYPGFPTDLQSQLMAVACTARGELKLKENIFSGRFKIVDDLKLMGADISVSGDTAIIKGNDMLVGREVTVKELRGGAGLVIAGLAARNMTVVSDSGYINRGYENIVRDISKLGALIENDQPTDIL